MFRRAAPFVLLLALLPAPSTADPITATLEACVALDDPRLPAASWYAVGTFRAVAWDGDEAGCEPTLGHPVDPEWAYDFADVTDPDGIRSLTARLRVEALPTCGRRQYDVHYYLSEGVLDPWGLKSLVVDTGVDCAPIAVPRPSSPPTQAPEPGPLALCLLAFAWRVRP